MTVVIGNPKLGSRTRDAADRVHEALLGARPEHTIEIAELGAGLLGWGDETVADAVRTVRASSFVVFASPTFKATYTGLLKLFLDQFDGGEGLRDVVVVPLLLGGGPVHALAAELTLKPVLSELGAVTATPGLYLIDSAYTEDGAIDAYAERWGQTVRDAVAGAERRRSA